MIPAGNTGTKKRRRPRREKRRTARPRGPGTAPVNAVTQLRGHRLRRAREPLCWRDGRAAIADTGLLLACTGCCCGHPERGGPKTAPGTLKREVRRAFRAAGGDGVLRLAFTECLGPCSEANVVLVYLHGRPLWLRRMNGAEAFEALLDWARAAAANGATPLPPALAARSFTWTGGGTGPAPPVEP